MEYQRRKEKDEVAANSLRTRITAQRHFNPEVLSTKERNASKHYPYKLSIPSH